MGGGVNTGHGGGPIFIGAEFPQTYQDTVDSMLADRLAKVRKNLMALPGFADIITDFKDTSDLNQKEQ